jgi:ribonuclease Z
VPPGPLFGQLQRGQPVTLADGTTVQPGQVLGEARGGRKVVLSGDTRPCAAMREAARDADLLIHESTFGDDEQARAIDTRHSTAREAGRVAREAPARRLVLTHFSARHDVDPRPLLEQARQEFQGPVEAAFDGLTIELPLKA